MYACAVQHSLNFNVESESNKPRSIPVTVAKWVSTSLLIPFRRISGKTCRLLSDEPKSSVAPVLSCFLMLTPAQAGG